MTRQIAAAILFICCTVLIWFFLALPNRHVYGRDIGQYKDSPLHNWFDSLASKNGLCCSFADGRTIDDPDIDMDGGHYRVRVDGEWIDVPDAALVAVPNRFGRPVVWPYKSADGKTVIRCFLPGAGI